MEHRIRVTLNGYIYLPDYTSHGDDMEFLECQEIKCMGKQWIPGSFHEGLGMTVRTETS